jgi:histidinol-phosphate aminotransferase
LFSRAATAAAAARLWSEPALAQRALVAGAAPPGTVWLNANENPEGPGEAAIEAMSRSLAGVGRYHFQEFREFYAAIARSVGLDSSQVLVGAGSSEVICAAVHAFTSAGRPLVYSDPTFELPVHLARALGREAVPVPPDAETWSAGVRRMAAEVNRRGGGGCASSK